MTSTRTAGGRPRARRLGAAALAALVAVVGVAALSGFHRELREIDPSGADAASELSGTVAQVGIRTFHAPDGIRIDEDLEYGVQDDGTLLTLDVCRPSQTAAVLAADDAGLLPAVVSIHGGSWARGDKANADWRNVCAWLASEGFVAASVNYRLVPDVRFPAAIDDVSLAVSWLREPEQLARFGIDPARIGAFGGSAGGNLAALLGARGEGALDSGARVAAVAEISGPVGLGSAELTADGASPWLRGIVAEYLGCEPDADADACPQATDASPATFADPSDPPFLVVHAESEVVPLAQSRRFAADLASAGVPVELAVSAGAEHSIGILDEAMRARVGAFLHEHLG
ncbi:alpha/beta hydrolase [Agromyces sp. NPDC058110]|uniref:alpha/beta hydrolase n=1 Tax=Agromyces sp. NPDC058110 TaxID=3346345 RepID=UPI0036DE5D2B